MPKDDTQSTSIYHSNTTDVSGPSDLNSSQSAPLKRGAACLYCRKRRIRCNAAKPTCDHCKKLKRECVYDTGKPVSRVKQLEEKVAELEGLLGKGTGALAGEGTGSSGTQRDNGRSASGSFDGSSPKDQSAGLGSGGTSSLGRDPAQSSLPRQPIPEGTIPPSFLHQPATTSATQYSIPPGTESRSEINFESMQVDPADWSQTHSFHGAGATGGNPSSSAYGANIFGLRQVGSSNFAAAIPGVPAAPPMAQQKSAAEMFDFSTLDPSFTNLINQFQGTSTGTANGPGAPQQSQGFSSTRQQTQPGSYLPKVPVAPLTMGAATDLPKSFETMSPGTIEALDTPGLFDLLTSSNNQLGTDYDFTSEGNVPTNTNSAFGSSGYVQSTPQMVQDQTGSQYRSTTLETIPDPQRSRQPSEGNAVDVMAKFAGDPSVQALCVGITDADLPNASTSAPTTSSAFQQYNQAHMGNTPSGSAKFFAGSDQSAGPMGGATGTAGAGGMGWTDPEMEGLPLVGGWFDAADLPTVARDHLLDLFFGGMKTLGQVYHIPRFRASLTLPPSRRPHPCLLYTMYLLASRMSTAPSIRSLEAHFYSIALRQLEESVARADRLLDATRAATMLAVYKFSLARYHEGYMMTGMAARLAVGAGLHQITSCVWKPAKFALHRQAALGELMRQRAYVIGPPVDAIDLGERIWAFWAIYTVDRCGSIASQWPPALSNEIISTPFPRPLAEYELGLVSEKDNITIAHLWCPPNMNYCPQFNRNDPGNEMIFRVRALAILEKASNLMYLTPEPGWDANLNLNSSGPSPTASGQSGHTSTSAHNNAPPMTNTWTPWGDQPIDDFLRTQNFVAWQFDEQAKLFAANSTMGMGNMGNMGSMGSMGGVGGVPGMGGMNGMGGVDGIYGMNGMNGTGAPYGGTTIGTNNPSPAAPSPDTTNSKGWTRCARIRTPKAYEEVRQALLRVEMEVPPEMKINWEVWNGWDKEAQEWHARMLQHKEAMSGHFVIGCAWMFLFDVFSFMAENTLAVNVARRLTYGIHMVSQGEAFNAMDVFIAMVSDDVKNFTDIVRWSFIVKILIREAKRLHSLGNHKDSEAGPIESEIEIVVQALRKFGERYNIASMQALRADRYRKSSAQETAFMEDEDYDDEIPA